MLKDDFPQIWVPNWENRDLRQLLWHRHRMVQARTRVMNQLQAVALNERLRCKKRLWREAGGSGASDGAQPSGMAEQVFSPGHATRAEDCEGREARKLAVQLYWMMRKEWDYEQVRRFGPHAGQPEHRRGVQ
jgi:hypothetical protein